MHYTTGSLHDHKAYWADIEAFEDYSRMATIDAEVKPNNVIEVKADNVARFTLTPPAATVDAKRPLTLTVNGEADARKFTAGQPIEWPEGAGATTQIRRNSAAPSRTAIAPRFCWSMARCSSRPRRLPRRSRPPPDLTTPDVTAPARHRRPDIAVTGTNPRRRCHSPTDRDNARRFESNGIATPTGAAHQSR